MSRLSPTSSCIIHAHASSFDTVCRAQSSTLLVPWGVGMCREGSHCSTWREKEDEYGDDLGEWIDLWIQDFTIIHHMCAGERILTVWHCWDGSIQTPYLRYFSPCARHSVWRKQILEVFLDSTVLYGSVISKMSCIIHYHRYKRCPQISFVTEFSIF
jgi:hypothetical protein